MLRSQALNASLSTLLSPSAPLSLLLTSSGSLLASSSLPSSPHSHTPLLALLVEAFEAYAPAKPTQVSLHLPDATVHVHFLLQEYLLAVVAEKDAADGAILKRMEG